MTFRCTCGSNSGIWASLSWRRFVLFNLLRWTGSAGCVVRDRSVSPSRRPVCSNAGLRARFCATSHSHLRTTRRAALPARHSRRTSLHCLCSISFLLQHAARCVLARFAQRIPFACCAARRLYLCAFARVARRCLSNALLFSISLSELALFAFLAVAAVSVLWTVGGDGRYGARAGEWA